MNETLSFEGKLCCFGTSSPFDSSLAFMFCEWVEGSNETVLERGCERKNETGRGAERETWISGGGWQYSIRKERMWVGRKWVSERGMADTEEGRGRETWGMVVDLAQFTASWGTGVAPPLQAPTLSAKLQMQLSWEHIPLQLFICLRMCLLLFPM